MGLTITKMLLPQSKHSLKCPNTMNPIGTTTHETGNKATAMAEVSYMVGNNSSTSYHFAVDETRAVQGLPLNRNGFHSSDGSSGRGNAKTIALEHCYNWNGKTTTKNDGTLNPLYQKAVKNGVELQAQLFIQYPEWGTPQSGVNMWRHYDHSRKNCPQRMIEEGYWNTYVALVKARYLELKGGKNTSPVASGSYTVKKGDTLWGIANTHKSTVASLNSLNGLKNDIITPGQVLKLSGNVVVQKPTPTPAPVEPQASGDLIIREIQANTGSVQDGWDGSNTRKGVVKLFQRFFGANDDGLIGNETLNKSQVIRLNSQGWHVYAVQAMLYLKGYKSVGKPDKIWGVNSVQATKNFQKDNGLVVDGTPGKQVYAKLFK